jgi:hypothetical protein
MIDRVGILWIILTETRDVIKGLLHIIDAHGTPTQRAHGTTLMMARGLLAKTNKLIEVIEEIESEE